MLQETKVQDDDFPFNEFSDMDYKIFISGQKSYNGVAIFSKLDGQIENSFVKNFDEQKDLLCLKRISLFLLMFTYQMAILLVQKNMSIN